MKTGPAHLEWIYARGHYEVAALVGGDVDATVRKAQAGQGAHPTLAFDFWQWQIYCTCIEVGFKAFLLSCIPDFAVDEGAAWMKMKKKPLGHNLRGLLDCANREGLEQYVVLDKNDHLLIDAFNKPFNHRAWIYGENHGSYSFAHPIELQKLAFKLLTGIHRVCDLHSWGHEMQPPK
ncbi:MAG: hypothetical protein V3W41_04285 [Planctomycetota bacterium]